MRRRRSKKKSKDLTQEEAFDLAERRWQQLCRLEPSTRKREQKLINFLRRKGVSYDMASKVLERVQMESDAEVPEDVHEEEAAPSEEEAFAEALELGQGRWRKLERLEENDRKRRDKLKKYLMRRGIGFDIVKRVLDHETIAA